MRYQLRETTAPVDEDFLATLAEQAHVTTAEVEEHFANCILCDRTATVFVVGIDQDIFRHAPSTFGKLSILLYGFCGACSRLPDRAGRALTIISYDKKLPN